MLQDLTEWEENEMQKMQIELEKYVKECEGEDFQSVVSVFFMMKLVQMQSRMDRLQDALPH